MSQSTLITIVLAIIIIAIFLVDYFKNKKKDPIEEGIKEFVEKESAKKSWYKTNKLFWLLPVSYILSILFTFLFFMVEDKLFREYLNFDTTKEISHADFDNIFIDHLNNKIRILEIKYFTKNYENIYFIETSNITSLDKKKLNQLKQDNNNQAFDLLNESLDKREDKYISKLYLDENIPLISNDLYNKYWEKVEILVLESPEDFSNSEISKTLFPKLFDLSAFIRKGEKMEWCNLNCYKSYDEVSIYWKFEESIPKLGIYRDKIYYSLKEMANDLSNSFKRIPWEKNKLETFFCFRFSEWLIPKNFNVEPSGIYFNFVSLQKQNPSIRFNLDTRWKGINLDTISDKYSVFNFVYAFFLFPILLFFRFFFFVGGISWFLIRKKNISMYLFLLFFLSYILYALEFSYGIFEGFILIFPLISFFVWFFNDKIKAQ